MLNSKELFSSIKDALNGNIPIGEREAIAFLILDHNGISKNQVVAGAPTAKSIADFQTTIEGVNKGLPIQYVLGSAQFYGLDFFVDRSVLIPRTETEELVAWVIEAAKGRKNLRVLDLCTGSGAIAVSLATFNPSWKITATDISEAALKVARLNGERHQTKVDFRLHDALSSYLGEQEQFEIIVSNPPYIDEGEKSSMPANVLEYEPSLALFTPSGDPLAFYRSISKLSMKHLCAGGLVAVELNPYYANEVAAIFSELIFTEKEVHLDSSGHQRFFTARRR
ncbi:MAG: peptide chain release factor N(5)-glutamine methyltransferase [Bacteroidetes bacterium]|nr:peptide chain release factor N(5)-glutamine methyltransferase [Bacteroidota bacterium]